MTAKEIAANVMRAKYEAKGNDEVCVLVTAEIYAVLESVGLVTKWQDNFSGALVKNVTFCGVRLIQSDLISENCKECGYEIITEKEYSGRYFSKLDAAVQLDDGDKADEVIAQIDAEDAERLGNIPTGTEETGNEIY